jgi:hypothetical protein
MEHNRLCDIRAAGIAEHAPTHCTATVPTAIGKLGPLATRHERYMQRASRVVAKELRCEGLTLAVAGHVNSIGHGLQSVNVCVCGIAC